MGRSLEEHALTHGETMHCPMKIYSVQTVVVQRVEKVSLDLVCLAKLRTGFRLELLDK